MCTLCTCKERHILMTLRTKLWLNSRLRVPRIFPNIIQFLSFPFLKQECNLGFFRAKKMLYFPSQVVFFNTVRLMVTRLIN